MTDSPLYWSDQLAEGTEKKFPDRDIYTVASGISPSGTVHVGNFREVITTELVARSLERRGLEVRFIYSWDDYDRFRKVPENVPGGFEKHIGRPLSDVPDPEGCHSSYAEHFEKKFEEELERLEIQPEFIRQSEMFRSCEYADLMRDCMRKREKIREILDSYRSEPLEEDWSPLRVYCSSCGRDFTTVTGYNGGYILTYRCEECGEERETDFSEEGDVKPQWRVDWPMRWEYENVLFEPAGKEHSAAGGSRDTANEIVRELFDREPPVHQMYEFVTRDGSKISSSSGEDLFTVSQLLEIYTPSVARFLFAGTRPRKSFEIPFESEEIFQRYEGFDRAEEAYFKPESVENDRRRRHLERVYEQSVEDVPESKPDRVPFKHCAVVAQTSMGENWRDEALETLEQTGHLKPDHGDFEREAAIQRLERARRWTEDYAPEKHVLEVNYDPGGETRKRLEEDQLEALEILKRTLEKEDFSSREGLDSELYEARDKSSLDTAEFFRTGYIALLDREEGPRLSTLIEAIGVSETAEILGKILEDE